jgi:hypothetical protein
VHRARGGVEAIGAVGRAEGVEDLVAVLAALVETGGLEKGADVGGDGLLDGSVVARVGVGRAVGEVLAQHPLHRATSQALGCVVDEVVASERHPGEPDPPEGLLLGPGAELGAVLPVGAQHPVPGGVRLDRLLEVLAHDPRCERLAHGPVDVVLVGERDPVVAGPDDEREPRAPPPRGAGGDAVALEDGEVLLAGLNVPEARHQLAQRSERVGLHPLAAVGR